LKKDLKFKILRFLGFMILKVFCVLGFIITRVKATRGYATPATQAPPPPFALENSLTDTKKKPQKKKKKRSVLAQTVPGNYPDGQTDGHRKQNPRTTKQNKKKKKKKKKGLGWPRNCPDNSPPIGSQASLITSK
jgi:hypothetical protein